MKRNTFWLIFGAMAFAIVVAGFPTAVSLLTDWFWFRNVEFESVFLKGLWARVLLGGFAGLFAGIFFYINLRFASRGVLVDIGSGMLHEKLPHLDVNKVFRAVTLPVAAAIGILAGISTSSAWLTVLGFLNRTPFGVVDPVFHRDVGFYVFTLPVLGITAGFGLSLVVLAVLTLVPIYVLRGDLKVRQDAVTMRQGAGMHLAGLVAGGLVIHGLNLWFVRIPSLLFSSSGPIEGVAYADQVARIPLLKGWSVAALIAAGAVVWGARKGKMVRAMGLSLGIYLLIGVVGGAYPAAVQRFIVAPNELAKETPFIERHVAATRAAWGIDEVAERTLTGEDELTLDDIRANAGTVRNVRLWDREPLLQTFGQLQEIRTYYDFVSVDDDRYWIDGTYRQVLLSPRELNSASLPTRNFINEHLTFTHGMGLTLSPVNQVTPEGLPFLFIQDLPPRSSVSIHVTRPQIYFGELANDYSLVRTAQPEFDYPSGDSSATTEYTGSGGVPVGSFWRRLLFSAKFGTLKILLSQDITNESRIIYHKNIRERAAKALPFLVWDSDPYIMITDEGHLKWILDAYTRTSRYPYALAMADGTRYMRNSVKVVMDAYDGSIQAYVSEPDDPLINTYERIFPEIFLPLDEMPADIRSHIRYPEDLFRVQTSLYTTYHMVDPTAFYHREDQWQIPAVAARDGGRDVYLRHIIMKLPGEPREEFIMMTPFTPRGKDNLAAWMVARNDGDSYGSLVVYKFPRQSLVFGPTQVVNRINQDTEISRQISLWDQRGSEVIRGNLLVIPIEESLLFVQALYLRAENGRIPELKRVIVTYQNRVVMEETLDAGLVRLFGGGLESEVSNAEQSLNVGVPVSVSADPRVQSILREAQAAYEGAMSAQREGNWSAYGEAINRVGDLLRQLQGLMGREQ
ncbi:MAG: UPF0182 family protein [Gemmatimonadota bacterium]|nr:UPF0182 family protein [Gemmatimonadota bacterium]